MQRESLINSRQLVGDGRAQDRIFIMTLTNISCEIFDDNVEDSSH